MHMQSVSEYVKTLSLNPSWQPEHVVDETSKSRTVLHTCRIQSADATEQAPLYSSIKTSLQRKSVVSQQRSVAAQTLLSSSDASAHYLVETLHVPDSDLIWINASSRCTRKPSLHSSSAKEYNPTDNLPFLPQFLWAQALSLGLSQLNQVDTASQIKSSTCPGPHSLIKLPWLLFGTVPTVQSVHIHDLLVILRKTHTQCHVQVSCSAEASGSFLGACR